MVSASATVRYEGDGLISRKGWPEPCLAGVGAHVDPVHVGDVEHSAHHVAHWTDLGSDLIEYFIKISTPI